MFFKDSVLCLMIGIIFTSCAQPKYVTNPDSNTPLQQNQTAKSECTYSFTQSDLCLSWLWEIKPTDSQTGSLIFKTYRLNAFDKSMIPLSPSSIPILQLWMPSMGHGSVPTQTTQLDIGTYRVTNVFFVMPGEWQFKFQIKAGDQIEDEIITSVTF